MRVTILASGSSGNATMFESNGTRVLIDAGLGPRTLAKRLREEGLEAPHAVIVTHAHRDHLGHAGALGAAYNIPVYLTEATKRVARIGGGHSLRVYGAREPFSVGALTVSPTPLPHDAAQVALVVSDGTRSAAIVTDLGEVPPALPPALAACDVLLIESNHDADMLRRGPYPQFLKKRVASARGHLSNAQTCALLRALPDAAHTVVLMHLSRTNNLPEIALAAAAEALAGRRVRLHAATQFETTAVDANAERPDAPASAAAVATSALSVGAAPWARQQAFAFMSSA